VNKTVRILLALGLILALAAPAFAEFKLNGYYRLMGYTGELKDATEEGDSQQVILQRLRMMLTYSLNDNVAIVYHGEVDTDWGSSSKGAIGGGGKFGADGVNVETKNVYLDLKSGDTSARLGVQGIADDFDGIVVNADMAGVLVNHKMGNTGLKLIYSKWDEGNSASNWDGQDFYGAVVSQKFSDSFDAKFGVYWMDENDAASTTTAQTQTFGAQTPAVITGYKNVVNSDYATKDIFFFGPRATYKAGDLTLDGWLVFQDGDVEYDNTVTTADYDISGFVGSLKASMKIDGGDVNFRFIYGSEDDDSSDVGAWQGDFDQYAFVTDK